MAVVSQSELPTEQETQLARESGERLAHLLSQDDEAQIRVRVSGSKEFDLTLPLSVTHLLLKALQEMGRGNGITLTTARTELTTQQAAKLLNVSRPYLIEELLQKGKLPFRKVGNRRRIGLADVLRFRQEEEQEISRRETVMRDLVAETQRLGLYR